jgi:hypothetical protein
MGLGGFTAYYSGAYALDTLHAEYSPAGRLRPPTARAESRSRVAARRANPYYLDIVHSVGVEHEGRAKLKRIADVLDPEGVLRCRLRHWRVEFSHRSAAPPHHSRITHRSAPPPRRERLDPQGRDRGLGSARPHGGGRLRPRSHHALGGVRRRTCLGRILALQDRNARRLRTYAEGELGPRCVGSAAHRDRHAPCRPRGLEQLPDRPEVP